MSARLSKLLLSRRAWTAAGVPVAAFVALCTIGSVSVFPPSVKLKSLTFVHATTRLYFMPHGSLGNNNYLPWQYIPREITLADQVASPELHTMIAKAAGIDPRLIAIDGPLATDQTVFQNMPTQGKRANQIVVEGDPYRITIDEDPALPTIGVTVQAPEAAEAVRLVKAVQTALSAYLTGLATSAETPLALRLEVHPLAPVAIAGGSSGGPLNVAVLSFVIALTLWIGLAYAVTSVARDLRRLRQPSWPAKSAST